MIGICIGVCTAISLGCSYLSDKEKKKQARLNQELDEYKANVEKEIEGLTDSANKEIEVYRKDILEKKRTLSNPFYKKLCRIVDERIRDKQDALKLCYDAFEEVESTYKKHAKSYARAHTMRKSLYSIKETCCKVEAYIEYLNGYKHILEFKFQNEGEILAELFSFTLPEDYPYEGKVLMLSKEDFNKKETTSGVFVEYLSGYNTLNLSLPEIPFFEKLSNNELYPFMVASFIDKNENKRQVLSLGRGIVLNSVGNTDGFDAEIVNEYADGYLLSVYGTTIARIKTIDIKRDLFKSIKKGSVLKVYAKQYNYALTELVEATQLPTSSISIEYFETLPLIVSEDEAEEIEDFVCKNNFDQNSDLWKIAPSNDEFPLNIKMQSANDYILYASFEEINGKMILKYKGLTADHDKFIDYGDAYVTTKASLEPSYLSEIDDSTDTSETELLHMYLVNEFEEQRKLLVNSPINLYVSQWSNIMERLYEKKSLGSSFCLDISEVKVQNNNDVILTINNKVLKSINEFYKKGKKEKKDRNDKTPFIIFILNKKYNINWKLSEDDQLYDKIEFKLHKEHTENDLYKSLISSDFKVNIYAGDSAYAEKKQLDAINNYKHNKIVDEEVKRKFNNPEKSVFKDNNQRIITLDNENLLTNPSQLDAVKRSFAEDKFFLIQGPPGTGKTTVIKELIHQQLNKNEDSRILIVSQSNVAVDNVLKGLDPNRFKFIRCATLGKVIDDKIKDFTYDNQCELYNLSLNQPAKNKRVEELRDKWKNFILNQPKEILADIILSGYQIIGATCVGLENRTFGLGSSEFDLVIIDEAGKALIGELLIPINRAKKVVMIGDHKQLPPVVDPLLFSNNKYSTGNNIEVDDIIEDDNKDDFFDKSIFYRLFTSMPDCSKVMLNTQFRMPKVIGDLVNMFYDGQLLTGANCLSKIPLMLDSHLIFIDMSDESNYKEMNGNGSPRNPKEVEVVLLIIKKIREQGIINSNKRIVVITPYKGQKYEIFGAIRSHKEIKNVVVDTVDAFQGDEEDVVIFCSTRAITPTKYFSTPERLNVAFSRTKNTLIYIGSSQYFSKFKKSNSVMQCVGNYLSGNAKIISYSDLVNTDFSLHNKEQHKKLSDCDTVKYPISYGDDFFFDKDSVKSNEEVEIENINTLSSRQDRIQKTKELQKYQNLYKNGVYCLQCGSLFFLERKKDSVSKVNLCDICSNEKVPYFVCRDCNITQYRKRKFSMNIEKSYIPTRCNDCKEKHQRDLEVVEIIQCKDCGIEIRITRKQKEKHDQKGWDLPSICDACKDKRNKQREENKRENERKNTIVKHCTCSECGDEFSITQGEVEFYSSKGFDLPKKCKNCRGNKKTV